MKQTNWMKYVASLGLVMGALTARSASAQSMAQAGSGVKAYFGSQSGVYLASNPSVGPYTFPGTTGPYPTGAGLPNIPAAPVSPVYPLTFSGNNFQTFTGDTSTFNDGQPLPSNTNATSTIIDSYVAVPSTTADASVQILNWQFNQALSASGYAWEQLNFGADYLVVAPTGLAAATPNFPLSINGTVAGAGFVQFDGVVNYEWIPVNADGTVGTSSSLGSLSYTYLSTGPTFSTTIFSSGSLSSIPIGGGALELTGHFWVAGDPFTINISSVVPEPASAGLLAMGLGLLVRRRRQ